MFYESKRSRDEAIFIYRTKFICMENKPIILSSRVNFHETVTGVAAVSTLLFFPEMVIVPWKSLHAVATLQVTSRCLNYVFVRPLKDILHFVHSLWWNWGKTRHQTICLFSFVWAGQPSILNICSTCWIIMETRSWFNCGSVNVIL